MKTNHSKHQPPRWANRLLAWFCTPHLLEEVEGDLAEEFNYQVAHRGLRAARWDYARNVLGFFRFFATKRKSSPAPSSALQSNLIPHYFMIAFRNIRRYKAFSSINIIGLALGMTCCLLILLWVQDERSIDNFHKDGDQLYSLYVRGRENGHPTWAGYGTPPLLSREIVKIAPEIEHAVGFGFPWGHPETFQVGDKVFKMEGSRASEDFFKILDYKLLYGSAQTALRTPDDVVISRKMADLFFGSPEKAYGQLIRFENKKDLKVSAVFENVPSQSSLKFDYLLSWEALLQDNSLATDWGYMHINTFIKLRKDADPADTEKKLLHFFDTYFKQQPGSGVEIGLQRYGDRYLHTDLSTGYPTGGRIEYVRLFTGVAVFILIMACINFMNLATARAVKRSKEVGVRKVVGSARRNLVTQFMSESLTLTFCSLLLALVLAGLALPFFNSLTEKEMIFPIENLSYWGAITALTLITGFIAGSYPALFLSSLQPVKVLKGTLKFSASTLWFRKGLVVFQFVLSIMLICATLVVSKQTNYIQTKNLGYERENVIYILLEGEILKNYLLFKEETSRMPGIKYVDRSSELPHAMGFVTDVVNWDGKDPNTSYGFKPASVGFDFIKMMNLKIVDGRDFSRDIPSDTAAFLLNEAAVKMMGVKDPVGMPISIWGKKGHVIGVLKDYHTHSLHEPIRPLILDMKEHLDFGTALIKAEAGHTKEAIASLEKVCKKLNPNYPFTYKFLDQEYEKLYHNEQVVTKLSNAFALIAIVISCLGLLGLMMFSAEQRTKEIGIRKVLGATVSNIIRLLSTDFLKLVLVSFIIAAPVAGFFMNKWLEGFAFKISLSWWIFAIAGGSAVLIALLTISVQAIHSALANPIKSLKSE